jgi:hypothetical protein
VDEKLNEYGIVKTINTALAGSNFLGNLLGGNTNTVNSGGLSQLASEQLVNGLFNIIEDYEHQNSKVPSRTIWKIGKISLYLYYINNCRWIYYKEINTQILKIFISL